MIMLRFSVVFVIVERLFCLTKLVLLWLALTKISRSLFFIARKVFVSSQSPLLTLPNNSGMNKKNRTGDDIPGWNLPVVKQWRSLETILIVPIAIGGGIRVYVCLKIEVYWLIKLFRYVFELVCALLDRPMMALQLMVLCTIDDDKIFFNFNDWILGWALFEHN